METRLNKFARAYQSTLSQLNIKVAYADLRYPNGFAVRKPVSPEAKLIAPKPIPATPVPGASAKATKA